MATAPTSLNLTMPFAEMLTGVIPWLDEKDRPAVKVWTKHLDGSQPAGERNRMLQKLRDVPDDECGVLTNARCLNEGIDVPALDGEVFVNPKSSVIDIIQTVGRVFRVAPGKDKGHIILPVFVHADDDPEEALKTSAFDPVWDVLRALRSHDVELGEWIDDYRCLLGKVPRCKIGPIKLPEQIKPDFGYLVGEEFAQAFILKMVKMASWTLLSFEEWCELMKKFVQEFGHATPLATYRTEDNFALGYWVNTMRTWKKKGWLKPERVKYLEENIPGWTWDALDDQWQETLRHFAEYAAEHGNTLVHDLYVAPDSFPLGRRLNTLRSQYNRGVLLEKFPERIEQLEALPGGWIWDAREAKWQANFAKYRSYVEQTGKQPTKETEFEGYRIGSWIHNQRIRTLTPEREKQLDEVPGWREPNKQGWQRGRGHRTKAQA